MTTEERLEELERRMAAVEVATRDLLGVPETTALDSLTTGFERYRERVRSIEERRPPTIGGEQ